MTDAPFQLTYDWDTAHLSKRRRVPIDEIQLTWPFDPDAQERWYDLFERENRTRRIQLAWDAQRRIVEAVGLIDCPQGVRDPSQAPSHPDQPTALPTLKEIACWLRAQEPKGLPTTALIHEGKRRLDPTIETPFLLKYDDNHAVWNEVIVGKCALNGLRSEIPNFMFVYGAHPIGATQWTSVIELLYDAETLFEFMRRLSKQSPIDEAKKTGDLLLLQLLLALAVAQERFDFSHNDLHADNVLVQTLPEPRTFTYCFNDGTTYRLQTRYLAILIDFGRSFVSVPLPWSVYLPTEEERAVIQMGMLDPIPSISQIHTGYLDPRTGLDYRTGNSLYDVCRLVDTTAAASVSSPLSRHVFAWLRPLFKDLATYQIYRAQRVAWEKSFTPVFMTKSISVREMVEARLRVGPQHEGDPHLNPLALALGTFDDASDYDVYMEDKRWPSPFPDKQPTMAPFLNPSVPSRKKGG